MPTQPPIPPLLQPYLSPSKSSLTLLTSTIGATTNWLLLRFIYTALKSRREVNRTDGVNEGHKTQIKSRAIILVSWLRDAAFWKDGGRKLGIDPQRLCIIDALSTSLGVSAPPDISTVEKTIVEAINAAQTEKEGGNENEILLILDGLDFLLAATAIPPTAVLDLLLELRLRVHSTIVTAAADSPLLHSPASPLEIGQVALLTGLAHQASWVMSVRELDTGVAKDVSGVLRVTKGAGSWEEGEEAEEQQEEVEGRECLYFVGRDGGVRVFERGA